MVHRYWGIVLAVLILVLIVILTGGVALAANPQVTLTVRASVTVGCLSGFTVTYVSDHQVDISWVSPPGGNNTMVRAEIGRYPVDRTDGYLVYYGNGTSVSDTNVNLDDTVSHVYYRGYVETSPGVWSACYVEGIVGGIWMTQLTEYAGTSLTLLFFFGVIALAATLTVFSWKIRLLVVRLAAALAWLVPGVYLLIGNTSFLNMDNSWVKILGFVLILATFIPISLHFMTETRMVKTTKKGSIEWSGYVRGNPSKKPKMSSEQTQSDYRQQLRDMGRRAAARRNR